MILPTPSFHIIKKKQLLYRNIKRHLNFMLCITFYFRNISTRQFIRQLGFFPQIVVVSWQVAKLWQLIYFFFQHKRLRIVLFLVCWSIYAFLKVHHKKFTFPKIYNEMIGHPSSSQTGWMMKSWNVSKLHEGSWCCSWPRKQPHRQTLEKSLHDTLQETCK